MPVQNKATLKGFFNTGDKPTEDNFEDLIDSVYTKDELVPLNGVNFGMKVLTYGATTTWTVPTDGLQAEVTLAGNTVLDVHGMVDGQMGALFVIQDGTGGWNITLPVGSKVAFAGAGSVILSTAPGAVDILTVIRRNSTLYWMINKSFT